MRCPKCNYVSHDYLDVCGKCNMDLVPFKRELHLVALQPGTLDLTVAFGDGGEGYGGRGGKSLGDSFFGTQMLVEPEGITESGEGEFDIKIDTDSPRAPTEDSPVPGELTRLFYVPEDLASHSAIVKPPGVAEPGAEPADTEAEKTSDAEATEEERVSPSSSGVESSTDRNIQSTVHTMEIDMSDLVDLDAGLDDLEEPSITMDAPGLDQESSIDLESPPPLEAESQIEPDMAPELDTVLEAPEEFMLDDPSLAPGELTKEFYVPEDLADRSSAGEPHDWEAESGGEAADTATEGPPKMEAAEDERLSMPSSSIESSAVPETPGTEESLELRLMKAESEPAVEEDSEALPDLESDDLMDTDLVLDLEDEEETTGSPPAKKRAADAKADEAITSDDLELEDGDKS